MDELSETKIISLLNKIHRAKMLSVGSEQAIKDVKLELDRSLLKRARGIDEKMNEKNEEIGELQNKLNNAKSENMKYAKRFAWQWFFGKTIICFGLSFGLFIVLGDEIRQSMNYGLIFQAIQIILFVFAPLFSIVPDFKKTRSRLL